MVGVLLILKAERFQLVHFENLLIQAHVRVGTLGWSRKKHMYLRFSDFDRM